MNNFLVKNIFLFNFIHHESLRIKARIFDRFFANVIIGKINIVLYQTDIILNDEKKRITSWGLNWIT